MQRIEPRTLKGFRDFLPDQAIRRQRTIETIVRTYGSFGFVPLETPALEYADVLTGKYGDEGEKLLYTFRDKGDRDVALRYDLTVPLARVVAQYPTIPKPFRRYQIAPVWRAENTQKGRFREFTQCDFDIVGTASMVADAEVAQLMIRVLQNLGVEQFEVRLNNRKILNGLLALTGVTEDRAIAVIRILDKWEKIGAEKVATELVATMGEQSAKKLLALLPQDDERTAFSTWTQRVATDLEEVAIGMEGIEELQQVLDILAASGVSDTTYRVDVLLARGLDYYTGTIFEAVLTNKPEFGSVFGGGRYDDLIGRFTGQNVPAVGASVGLDRLLAALEELGITQDGGASATVLVTMMDSELRDATLALANELRSAGISTELYYEPVKLDKQLKYADKMGIPFAVMFGSQEKASNTVTLKNLRAKKQTSVPRAELLTSLREQLTK